MAQDEGHLFNILNEKIVWNNNDNPSIEINKKQASLSLLDIEEACNKFYNIINQSEEKFLKNTSEYPDFLINKKKIENSPIQLKNLTESLFNNDNENIKEETHHEKIDEKNNNDSELLCEDEVKIIIFL